MLVRHQDVVEVDSLPHQGAGLGVGLVGGKKVRTHARTQVLRLANVDHFPFGVLVEVAARAGGQSADFLVQIHAERGRVRGRLELA